MTEPLIEVREGDPIPGCYRCGLPWVRIGPVRTPPRGLYEYAPRCACWRAGYDPGTASTFSWTGIPVPARWSFSNVEIRYANVRTHVERERGPERRGRAGDFFAKYRIPRAGGWEVQREAGWAPSVDRGKDRRKGWAPDPLERVRDEIDKLLVRHDFSGPHRVSGEWDALLAAVVAYGKRGAGT